MQSAEARNSLLYDYYGALLGERQNDVFRLYHEDNLTLAEIAEELGVSRQAVHTTLKKAAKALAGYEADLGLLARQETYAHALDEIARRVDGILGDGTEAVSETVKQSLWRIRRLIDELDF